MDYARPSMTFKLKTVSKQLLSIARFQFASKAYPHLAYLLRPKLNPWWSAKRSESGCIDLTKFLTPESPFTAWLGQ